jgi:hypothetical protein
MQVSWVAVLLLTALLLLQFHRITSLSLLLSVQLQHLHHFNSQPTLQIALHCLHQMISHCVRRGLPRQQLHHSQLLRQFLPLHIRMVLMMALRLEWVLFVLLSGNHPLLHWKQTHGLLLLQASLQSEPEYVQVVIFSMVRHVLFVLQELTIISRQQVHVHYVLLVTTVLLVVCQPQG